MSIMTSCSKDDKDEATDNSVAAMEEYANLKPTIAENGDNIVLTWAGKYYQATETISFVDGLATTAEYSGSIDCGGAVYAQIAYQNLTLIPDGTGITYGVQGSKVTLTRTENTYSGSTKEAVLEILQLLYE